MYYFAFRINIFIFIDERRKNWNSTYDRILAQHAQTIKKTNKYVTKIDKNVINQLTT